MLRVYTGRGRLMQAALSELLRRADARTQLVVVPKQLTLQTERLLLEALPVPEISGRTPDGREMRRALWAYVCEDGACLDQVRAWIAEEE